MFKAGISKSFLGLLAAAALTSTTFAAPPDYGLFTVYGFPDNFSNVYFSVCGSLPETEGCYGGGTFGPFGYVGAMLEGDPSTHGDTVARSVFVVDVAAGKSGDEVVLYRYLLTQTITNNSDDSITQELTAKVKLPLVGGNTVRCVIAGNSHVIIVGTDQSTQAVMLTKDNLNMQSSIGGGSGEPTVSAITADAYGYINVTFGSGANSSMTVIGPTGSYEEDGGGQSFFVSTGNGLSTKDVLTPGDVSIASRLAAHPVTSHVTSKIGNSP